MLRKTFQKKNMWVLLIVVSVLIPRNLAFADTENNIYTSLQTFGDLLLPKVSQITIGGGPAYSPDYFGSDDYKLKPRLAFYVRVDEYFTFGSDGLAFNILGTRNLQLGPIINITGDRKEATNVALAGLGEIEGSINAGIFGKVILSDRISIRARIFDDIVGGNNGAIADLNLHAIIHDKNDFSVAMGVKASWTEARRAAVFFGVTQEQSASSGLPVYIPGSSVSDVQGDIGARWEFKENWAINGYARYTRILGRNANSPLVKTFGSPDQLTVGTYLTYTFNL